MKSARALVVALAAAVLAIVFALARRVSRKTGRSIPASLPDVPGEAQRLASDLKSRATETVSDVRARSTEAVNTSLQTIRQKEAAVKQRIVGDGHAQEAVPEVVEGEVAEVETAE